MRHRLIPTLTPQEIQRFWNCVNIRDKNDCWNWNTGKTPRGYGWFSFQNEDHLAPRVSFFLSFGVNPGKWCVLHECDHPPCCNPKHLFLGTRKDNHADMIAKQRWTPPKGIRNSHAKLTEAQVKEIRTLYKSFPPAYAAKLYGVSKDLVYNVKVGKTWKHLLP